MTKHLLSCILVATAMTLQAQKMKPQKMMEFSWDVPGQNWNTEYTYSMKYNNAGNLVYRNTFDHFINKPYAEDSIVYDSLGNVIRTIGKKWNQTQNQFVLDTRVDNCFDPQQRDCGMSSFNWNGSSWLFTGGYQQSYIANTANNTLTQTLRVWSDDILDFEPQQSSVTAFNANGSKVAIVQNIRDNNSGFLVPHSKQEYAGWHNEPAGVFTSMQSFERQTGSWVASGKTIVEDSTTFWKYILQDKNQTVVSWSKKAKDESFTEDYLLVNGVAQLSHTFSKNGLTETETWLDYDASGQLQFQERVTNIKNQHGDMISITSWRWTPGAGWQKFTEKNFLNTYDGSGNLLETITTVYDANSGISQNERRVVYSDYIQIGAPLDPCTTAPTIAGELLICPNDETTLSTQQFDSYQWYVRPFAGNQPATPVTGAVNKTFTLQHIQTPVYVSVLVKQDTCTVQSAEVLVDGRVFQPLTIASSGNFSVNENGEQLICPGDSIVMEINLPYDTNQVWFNGDEMISSETGNILVVKEPGSYWAYASPSVCPAWGDALGTTIEVRFKPAQACINTIKNPEDINFRVYPNPVSDLLKIESNGAERLEAVMYDISGKCVFRSTFNGQSTIDVTGLQRGFYLLEIINKNSKHSTKITIQ